MHLLTIVVLTILFYSGFLKVANAAQPLTTVRLPKGAKCPVGRVPAYFSMPGMQSLTPFGSMEYLGVTESKCRNMCSDNIDSTGFPIICASFTYTASNQNCTISRGQIAPNGDLNLSAQDGSVYYEKFCLPANSPADCNDTTFYRRSQAILLGSAKNALKTKTLEICAQRCITAAFGCKSAMYYYEDGECILNKESAETQPSSFIGERNDKVEYIENGCRAKSKNSGNEVRKLADGETSDDLNLAVKKGSIKEELTVKKNMKCDPENGGEGCDKTATCTATAFIAEADHSLERDDLGTQFDNVTEDVCMRICTSNQDTEGNPQICQSVVYDRPSQTCRLSKVKPHPDGTAKPIQKPQSGLVLLEKLCLPDDVPTTCDQAWFYRHSQSLLLGFARQVSTTSSLAECAVACVNANFTCKSLMFYENDRECILNSESAVTQPSKWKRETKDKVIYLENGCLKENKDIAHNSRRPTGITEGAVDPTILEDSLFHPWGQWTICNSTAQRRVRVRNCKEGQTCTGKTIENEQCTDSGGWGDWLAACDRFDFDVGQPCLGFQRRPCLGTNETCQGPSFRYCFFEGCDPNATQTPPPQGALFISRQPMFNGPQQPEQRPPQLFASTMNNGNNNNGNNNGPPGFGPPGFPINQPPPPQQNPDQQRPPMPPRPF